MNNESNNNNNKSNEVFNYTYSAKQQSEIQSIRKKYLSETDKLEQLRRLDKGVTRKGTVISIILGVVGALLLGIGMCCTMLWTELFWCGIIVGCIGIAAVALAYPIYAELTKRERKKLAPEIIKLTDELMK